MVPFLVVSPTSRFGVLCSDLEWAVFKGPCPLTPTTATLWMLPEDILKQIGQENHCNRKMNIHWKRRFKMVHTELCVSLQKRTVVFKKAVVAALYYVLPRWGSTRYGITNAWRNGRSQEGHCLVPSYSSTMAS